MEEENKVNVEQEPKVNESKKQKMSTILLIAISVLLLIAIIIGCIILMNNNTKETNKEESNKEQINNNQNDKEQEEDNNISEEEKQIVEQNELSDELIEKMSKQYEYITEAVRAQTIYGIEFPTSEVTKIIELKDNEKRKILFQSTPTDYDTNNEYNAYSKNVKDIEQVKEYFDFGNTDVSINDKDINPNEEWNGTTNKIIAINNDKIYFTNRGEPGGSISPIIIGKYANDNQIILSLYSRADYSLEIEYLINIEENNYRLISIEKKL